MRNKNCTTCKCELNINNTKPYRIKNYIYKCDECVREEKKLQARNIDKKKSTSRSKKHLDNLKKDNPVRYTCRQMYSSAKKRAKVYSLPFDIDTDYLESISTKYCPVLRIEIKYGGGNSTKNSASLDKIIPELGYTKGNVQIVSNLANMMKSNANEDELIMFSKWVQDTYEKTKNVQREK